MKLEHFGESIHFHKVDKSKRKRLITNRAVISEQFSTQVQ